MPDLIRPDGAISAERLIKTLDALNTKLDMVSDSAHKNQLDIETHLVKLDAYWSMLGKEMSQIRETINNLVTRQEFTVSEKEQDVRLDAMAKQLADLVEAQRDHARQNENEFNTLNARIDDKIRDMQKASDATREWDFKRWSFALTTLLVIAGLIYSIGADIAKVMGGQ